MNPSIKSDRENLSRLSLSLILLLSLSAGLPSLAADAPKTEVSESAGETSPLQSRELVPVKGTRVRMIQPKGFKVSDTFNGFMEESKHASVMVTEMPAPAPKLLQGFTKENLAARRMELISRKEIEVSGKPGVLINLKQKLGPVEFEKWISVFGDDENAVLVVSAFPASPSENSGELSDELKTCVESVKWDQDKKLDKTAGLNFKIEAVKPLRLAHRIQNMLLFTEEGKFPATSSKDAIFLVGQSFRKSLISDKKAFCLNRIKQTASLDKVKELDVVDLSRGDSGQEGFEITAEAVDKKSGDKMFLYQVIIFSGDSYFIQQGLVADSKRSELEPVFREMSSKFKLNS